VPDPNPLAALVRRVNPGPGDVPDAELLDRFVRSADQAAFELLVWRHGAMVWGVCRRMLDPDRAAAEDACQAAFAALARHAPRLRGRAAVGAWLHRVAVRASIDLGRIAARRAPADHPDPPARDPDPARLAGDRELRSALDAGLNHLPDKLRVPFVLCELEGRTNAEAAAALGCPVGTVESRLTRARQRLRGWLTARGVVPGVAAAAVVLPESTRAALVRAADQSQLTATVRAVAARAIPRTITTHVRVLTAVGLVLAAGALGLAMPTGQEPPPTPPSPKGEIDLPAPQGPGEAVDMLVVEAWAPRAGQVEFLVRRNSSDPVPPAPPVVDARGLRKVTISATVDGTEVRAVGVDGRPLGPIDLVQRLAAWAAVVVLPADQGLPAPIYRAVLNERVVIFLVPRTVFGQMSAAAGARPKVEDPRPPLPKGPKE
jgi:RNA polymerase sigma factor (sigma-70 family)